MKIFWNRKQIEKDDILDRAKVAFLRASKELTKRDIDDQYTWIALGFFHKQVMTAKTKNDIEIAEKAIKSPKGVRRYVKGIKEMREEAFKCDVKEDFSSLKNELAEVKALNRKLHARNEVLEAKSDKSFKYSLLFGFGIFVVSTLAAPFTGYYIAKKFHLDPFEDEKKEELRLNEEEASSKIGSFSLSQVGKFTVLSTQDCHEKGAPLSQTRNDKKPAIVSRRLPIPKAIALVR